MKLAVAAQSTGMKWLKRRREKLKLKPAQMADRMQLSPQTYHYLESKAQGCSFPMLCHLRERLSISWEDLGSDLDDEYRDEMEMVKPPTIVRAKKRG